MKKKKVFAGIFILLTICIYIGLFILYGPWNDFRDWYITTAMSSMNHKNFANFFYTDEVIADCLNRNKTVEATRND